MASIIKQQPSPSVHLDEGKKDLVEVKMANKENVLSSRDNFPKGLRGGGPCFDCLACLCCCCAIEEIACFECCREC